MNGRISNFMQVAGIRRYTMSEGPECGLRVLDCDNGKLRFLLNESKALDVMQLYHEGQNLSFISKNGYTARETPFANRFEGGMLYTCGLDSVGGGDGFEQHGTHHNTPAKVTRAECSENGILVEAEMRETELFGKNLVFRRRVFSTVGSDTLEISDTLENRGQRDENYCILYHVNLGFPFLDAGVELAGEAEEVFPRTPWAKKNLADRAHITAPVANQEEMCYYLKMKTPQIAAVNHTLGKKFVLAWSGDTLPHFVQWKCMAAGDYALGLEPSTTELDERFAYRTIKANEELNFTVTFSVQPAGN